MSCAWARGSSSGSVAQYASSPSSTSNRVARARRRSVNDLSQTRAVSLSSSTSITSRSSPSSGGRPASSRVSMIVAAPAALPSRSAPSVNRRNSAAASSSSAYAEGNRRASTGSSGSVVGPSKLSIASSGSACSCGTAASLRSSSTSWDASDRSRSASNPENVAMIRPLRRCRVKPLIASSLLLERGPQAVLVHGLDVSLHLLARAVADHRPAVVVDLEHQLLGLLLVVAEVGAEHVGDVAHQVHRVVPDDGHPRLGRQGDLVGSEVRLDLDRTRGRHGAHRGTGHGAPRASTRAPYAGPVSSSTALLTDHYELTMLQAALGSATAHRRSVFELFPRRLPDGRRYGVVAGVGRALEAVERFRFTDEQISFLREASVVDDAT